MNNTHRALRLEELRLEELPDISHWGLVPLYTIEQAALLFAGIDPAFTRNVEDIKGTHPEQYRYAYTAKQAFLGGVVLKTLSVHELYISDFNNSYPASQETDSFSINDICTYGTTVKRMVLFDWAKREQFLSMRQIMQRKERQLLMQQKQYDEQREYEEQPQILIEHRPLEPIHSTPEFEAACQIVQEFWNNQPKGVKPPKESIVQELIEKTLTEKLGAKPSRAAIERVDTLTRPLQFKNQKPTKR